MRTITGSSGSRRDARPSADPHPVEHVEAAAALQPQIEHNKRGLAHLDRPQRLACPARPGDPKTIRGQVVEQKRTGRLVVLHHQNQALLFHTRKKDREAESRPSHPGSRIAAAFETQERRGRRSRAARRPDLVEAVAQTLGDLLRAVSTPVNNKDDVGSDRPALVPPDRVARGAGAV